MTKRDYERIASAIRSATRAAFENTDSTQEEYRDGLRFMRGIIITKLASELGDENPRFNHDTFRKACLTYLD